MSASGSRARATERPFFFRSGDRSLFGVFHGQAGDGSLPPFVFCHPFGEEKLWTQRVFVSFARALATEGHAVLRFDYGGNGDSEGDFSASSLTTAKEDVRHAIEWIRQETGTRTVGLLGLRLGATVASLVAEDVADVHQLVLWSPIVDGARYMQELLRINLTTQMAIHKEVLRDREALVAAMLQGETVNVDGYEMAHPMYLEVSDVKLAGFPKRHQGPCLITHIDRQPGRSTPELQQLAGTYTQASLTCAQEEPFWKEILRFYQRAPNLFESTLEWVRATTAANERGASKVRT